MWNLECCTSCYESPQNGVACILQGKLALNKVDTKKWWKVFVICGPGHVINTFAFCALPANL